MKEECKMRREKVRKAADLAYFTHPTELFYLTGMQISKGTLLICGERSLLFVDDRYLDFVKHDEGLQAFAPHEIEDCIKVLSFDSVSIDGSHISYAGWKRAEKLFLEKELIDQPLLREFRLEKSAHEIGVIERAAAITSEGFNAIIAQLEVGVTEKELARRLESVFLGLGADGIAFETIVAFGKNSAYPHYRPKETRLLENMAVTIDSGILLDKYCSDVTRSFYFGENAEYEKHWHFIQEAKEYLLGFVKAGVTSAYLDKLYHDFATERGYQEGIKHSLGHSLGLEVHEWPTMRIHTEDVPLVEGAVVAIEPGIYFPGEWGIRLEDMYLVEESGATNMTKECKNGCWYRAR